MPEPERDSSSTDPKAEAAYSDMGPDFATPSDGDSSDAYEAQSTGAAGAEVAQAKKEASENYERYLRAVADLENFRKRAVREKDELRQYATSRLLEDLVPVLDNLSLGLAAAKAPNADAKTVAGGVEMVLNQARSTLAQHGLKEINPLGQPFDPNQHESISAQPSATVPEGSVANVVRTGYSLNSRLLRPASVVVSSGPDKSSKTSS